MSIIKLIISYPIWFILVFPVTLSKVLSKFIVDTYAIGLSIFLLVVVIILSIFSLGTLSLDERKDIYNNWSEGFYWAVSYHFIDSLLLKLGITYINSFELTILNNLLIIGVYILMGFLTYFVINKDSEYNNV
jgi:hypothetical protein